MAIIQKGEYHFEVDLVKAIDYYRTHTLCKCDNCENFYTQIKGRFPKLESFPSDFGVDMSKPDEITIAEMVRFLPRDKTKLRFKTICFSVLPSSMDLHPKTNRKGIPVGTPFPFVISIVFLPFDEYRNCCHTGILPTFLS